jgi:hypothetical protein
MMKPDDRSSEEEASLSSRTPILSIGIAVLIVLMVPVFLSSVGPGGPIRVGDVVFATSRHRVPMIQTDGAGLRNHSLTCVLESRVQLVVQGVRISPEGSMIAEPIDMGTVVSPYCPPRVPVVVLPHQVTLRPDLRGGIGDMLSHFFSGL